MVDMGKRAISARLHQMSRLMAERGLVSKGVDMSPAAVSGRLKMAGALSDLCRRLCQAGAPLRAASAAKGGSGTP